MKYLERGIFQLDVHSRNLTSTFATTSPNFMLQFGWVLLTAATVQVKGYMPNPKCGPKPVELFYFAPWGVWATGNKVEILPNKSFS